MVGISIALNRILPLLLHQTNALLATSISFEQLLL